LGKAFSSLSLSILLCQDFLDLRMSKIANPVDFSMFEYLFLPIETAILSYFYV